MRISIFAVLLFCILSISAQPGSNITTLPQLGLNNEPLHTILSDVDAFIGNKPNGLHFPMSKIVFSDYEGLTCYEIVGIDNSWKDLFKFGEVPYGYFIMHNRLFLVVKQGYHDIDLTPLFYVTENVKSFNKNNNLPPTSFTRSPVWFFEYRDGQSYLISVSDLDVLD